MKDIISFLVKYPKANAKTILKAALEAIKPQPPLTVSQVVTKNMLIKTSNSDNAPYDMDRTKYMEEPLNLLASREYTQVIFMGPARTGKSEALLKGFATYCITYSFKNLLAIHMTEKKAAEWSKTELRPLINRSPALKQYKTNNEDDFNIYDIRFKNLNTISNRWPTITNLSAVTVPNVILTDYDRFPENIDGEGNPFVLARKRTTTFGLAGMCIAESSPGFLVQNPDAVLKPHECYQAKGIASLYSLGDQRCFYFQCVKCKEFFLAEPSTIDYNNKLETVDAQARSARVKCPHCGYKHDNATKNKILIPQGVWLAKGETIDKNRVKHGKKLISNGIASFWLRAPACAFASLESIVRDKLNAEITYEKTGDETLLQSFVNVTLGEPYILREFLEQKGKNYDNSNNIDSTISRGECPQDTLFIFATVDIQNGEKDGRFEIGIFAYTLKEEIYLVDRFKIETYQGQGLRPQREVKDFDVITNLMLTERIRVQGLEHKYLKIQGFAMDMGGNGDTTANAREFYHRFKQMYGQAIGAKTENDLRSKIYLFKGVGYSQKNNIQPIKYNKNELSSVRRAPGFSVQTYYYKDILYSIVKKPLGQINSIHFYNGISNKYLKEFDSEEKQDKRYVKKKGVFRNETLDLFVYALAVFDLIGAQKIVHNIKMENFKEVPPWAFPIDKGNSNLVIDPNYQTRNFQNLPPQSKPHKQNPKVADQNQASNNVDKVDDDTRTVDLDKLEEKQVLPTIETKPKMKKRNLQFNFF